MRPLDGEQREWAERHVGLAEGLAAPWLRRRGADRDEILSDAFLCLVESSAAPEEGLRIYRLRRNLPFRLARSSRKRAWAGMRRCDGGEGARRPLPVVEARDSGDDPALLLHGLDPDLSRPLILHHVEGRTQAEAARIMGIGARTVFTRLKAGAERLRGSWGEG